MKLSLHTLGLKMGLILLASSPLCEASPKKSQPSRCEPCCREIREVPFTIKVPGEYVINKDLNYRGSASAITVSAVGNVKIKFNGASLFLTDPNAIGIDIINAHEVTILEDEITFLSDQEFAGSGISIKGSDGVTINNCFFIQCGITIVSSSNISINKTTIKNHTRSGAVFRGCTNVTMEGCVLKDNAVGVLFGTGPTPNNDCKIARCDFPNSTGITNLFAQQVTGLSISDSSFSTSGGEKTTSLAQFGDVNNTANSANNITINRSTFINASTSPEVNPSTNFNIEGIVHLNGSGIMIDSVVVDVDHGDTPAPDARFSAIRLSGTAGGASIRNSNIKGLPLIGIYCLNITDGGAVIDNCTISSASIGINIESSSDCTVKSCTLTQCGAGVAGFKATNGTIRNNAISQSDIGVGLSGSESFTIGGNTISQCDVGISLVDKTNNTVTIDNVLNDNKEQYKDASGGNNLEQNNIKQPQ